MYEYCIASSFPGFSDFWARGNVASCWGKLNGTAVEHEYVASVNKVEEEEACLEFDLAPISHTWHIPAAGKFILPSSSSSIMEA